MRSVVRVHLVPLPVAIRLRDTPVPIPNTMVKTQAADDTMLATVWESRWLPDYRGYSSVGRAPALQAGGQGFESLYLQEAMRGRSNDFVKTRVRKMLVSLSTSGFTKITAFDECRDEQAKLANHETVKLRDESTKCGVSSKHLIAHQCTLKIAYKFKIIFL